jgi:hypothetical protein
MNEFEQRADAVAFLAEAIGDRFDRPEDAAAVAEVCADAFREQPDSGASEGAFDLVIITPIRWVIRNDDLKLFDAFFKAAGAAAGVNFFLAAATPAAIVGLLTAVFGVVRAVLKKGISLTEDQCRLLMALRGHGTPMSVSQVAGQLGLAEDEAKARLEALTKLRCRDGTVAAIVAEDGAGLWAPADV